MNVYILTPYGEIPLINKYIAPQIDSSNVRIISLPITGGERALLKECREFIESELPYYGDIVYLCGDKNFFRALTGHGATKTEGVRYTSLHGDGTSSVFYFTEPNEAYRDLNKYLKSVQVIIDSVNSFIAGGYNYPGSDIIHSCKVLNTHQALSRELSDIISRDKPITLDIETTGLKHYNADIVSIGIGYDEHNASIAFSNAGNSLQKLNPASLELFREFFKVFNNKIIYHKIDFDVTILIRNLYMSDPGDYDGLLNGLDIMLSNWDCTRLIAYLATNNCYNNDLSLKILAQPFAGDWGEEDIVNIMHYKPDTLISYNAKDVLSTWYVFNKYNPIMLADNQEEVYLNIFKPAMKDIIQMQLTGMPINVSEYDSQSQILTLEEEHILKEIHSSPVVKDYMQDSIDKWVIEKNKTLKRKRVTADDYKDGFSVGSTKQLRELFYKFMGLPVIEFTKKKWPSTSSDTIENLSKHTTEPEYIKLLDNIAKFRKINKINSSFIPAIGNYQPVCIEKNQNGDRIYWAFLYGNFNLGGTVSGRLSSSEPNLQNIPSSGKLAKLIKNIFQAPPGWLFVGVDFWSLEDRISALTTKDANKLKVYMGHIIYEVCVDGTIHHVRDDAIITFDGKTYTGEEFYDTFGSL